MGFRDQLSFARNVSTAVASLFVGSAFLLTAGAQESPEHPASSEQAASATAAVIQIESRIVLVDAVVTDKKGNYIHDLTQQDFRVYEDNKEQPIVSLTFGSEVRGEAPRGPQHHLVLLFDDASMQRLDQMQARKEAAKFIEQTADDDRVIAIAEFGGTLQFKQDFTGKVDLLLSAISGSPTPHIETNPRNASDGQTSRNEVKLGRRSLFLSIRTLAKSLRSIPGRRMLILFSSGFPVLDDLELLPELAATIDACNKANVTIYSVDVRGLASSVPGGSARGPTNKSPRSTQSVSDNRQTEQYRPRLVMASYSAVSSDAQQPGGGGVPNTGAAKTVLRNDTGENQQRSILPQLPPSADINQYLLRALADGTGGFTILNTNDLLAGLRRIARELDEFYILGYVPEPSKEGSCHTLKVKVARGGAEVRSRSGYCNTRPVDPLQGTPLEKRMEKEATGTRAGSIQGSIQVPHFYNGLNLARVNVTMDVPSNALNFNKDKGDYHCKVDVLGIAYKQDGTVAARFSDSLELNLRQDEWKAFTKQPYRYQNQFDVASGSYTLTVVFSAGGEHFGKFETPIQIAPYDGKALTLGGVVLSTDFQKFNPNSNQLDVVLVEDRSPLIANGVQVTPAAKFQFKKSDKVVLYSELYEPLLKNENPPKVGAGYVVFDKATNKEVCYTGIIPLGEFIERGNTVVPFTLVLRVSDWPPGAYRLVLLAVDSANNKAPQKEIEFTVSE